MPGEEGVTPLGGVSAATTVVSVVMKAYEMKRTAEFRETMKRGLLNLQLQLREVLANQEKIFNELEMMQLYNKTDQAEFQISTWHKQYIEHRNEPEDALLEEFRKIPGLLSRIDGAIRDQDREQRWLQLVINKLYTIDIYEDATTSRCQLAYLKYSDLLSLQAKGLQVMALAVATDDDREELRKATKNVLDRIRGTEEGKAPGQAQICQEIAWEAAKDERFLWIEPGSPNTQPYPWKHDDYSVGFGWNKPAKDPAIVQARVWTPSAKVLAPQLFTVPWEEKSPPSIKDAQPEGHIQNTAEVDEFRGVNKVTIDISKREVADGRYLAGIKFEQTKYREGRIEGDRLGIERQDLWLSMVDQEGEEYTDGDRNNVDVVTKADEILWFDGGLVPRGVKPAERVAAWAPFTGIRFVRRPYKHDSSIGVVCLSLQCRWNLNNFRDWGGITTDTPKIYLRNQVAKKYLSFRNQKMVLLQDFSTDTPGATFNVSLGRGDFVCYRDEMKLKHPATSAYLSADRCEVGAAVGLGQHPKYSEWTIVDPRKHISTEIVMLGQPFAIRFRDQYNRSGYLSLRDGRLQLHDEISRLEVWEFIRAVDVH